jgi:hypothetical protein
MLIDQSLYCANWVMMKTMFLLALGSSLAAFVDFGLGGMPLRKVIQIFKKKPI